MANGSRLTASLVMGEQTASLIRRGRRNAHYTAIPNHIITNPGLSPDARITQIYLLSKPDDWQLQVNDLRRLLGTGAKRCGRNKAYEVIKELKTAGYVVAVEDLQQGRFNGLTYYVFDEPLLDPDGFKAELRGVRPASDPGDAASVDSVAKEPCPEIRDTAPAPRPQFRDPVKRQLTKHRKKQITESPPSPPSRSYDGGPKAGAGGETGFSKLWADWPETERPRERGLVESLFRRLSQVDQGHAVHFASLYCTASRRRCSPARMIPYLRNREFMEFYGAPPQTVDGFFDVRPGSAEWQAWADHLKPGLSAETWARQEALGYLACRTRWPDKAKPEAKLPAAEGAKSHRAAAL